MTREGIERLCWRLSGWTVEQRAVDKLLGAVDAYVAGMAPQGGALVTEAGESAPEGAREASADLVPADDTPAAEIAPQGGAQRFELVGPVTLVLCHGQCSAPAAAPDAVPDPLWQREPHPGRDLTGRFVPQPRATVTGIGKECSKCRLVKPLDDFSRDAKGNGGRRYACRDCENQRKRAARQARARAGHGQEAA